MKCSIIILLLIGISLSETEDAGKSVATVTDEKQIKRISVGTNGVKTENNVNHPSKTSIDLANTSLETPSINVQNTNTKSSAQIHTETLAHIKPSETEPNHNKHGNVIKTGVSSKKTHKKTLKNNHIHVSAGNKNSTKNKAEINTQSTTTTKKVKTYHPTPKPTPTIAAKHNTLQQSTHKPSTKFHTKPPHQPGTKAANEKASKYTVKKTMKHTTKHTTKTTTKHTTKTSAKTASINDPKPTKVAHKSALKHKPKTDGKASLKATPKHDSSPHIPDTKPETPTPTGNHTKKSYPRSTLKISPKNRPAPE